jgi:acetyltransferase-like isoleucine patch superfamily enzyme
VAEPLAIVIPRETVNDDVVLLARWHVQPGEHVRAGTTLLEFETSKTVYTLEAERDGWVEITCAEGDEIAVGDAVGRLHEQVFVPSASSAPSAAAPAAGAARPAGEPGASAITRKARQLIDERGLDPAQFGHLAIVREADVVRLLEARAAAEGHGAAGTTANRSASAPAAGPGPGGEGKGSFHDLLTSSRERGHGVVWLAFNYVFRNWLLGMLVRVAPRGLILPLHRLRGVKLGSACYIDPTAIVETAYPENVTIGNDVRITAHAVIMTHIKAPHYLRETGLVPNVLAPVVLEDHCFIGVNSVIMPGVTVGKASVVASGSVVFGDVPPFTMVQGNPARVVKRFPRPKDAKA